MVPEVLQRRWEPWRWEAQWSAIEVDDGQLKVIIRADPLITTWEVAKELNFDLSLLWHLKKTGKVKKRNKWVPLELIKNQRNHRFEVSCSFILWNNNEPFLDWTVTHDERQPVMTRLSGWTEKLQSTSQSQTAPKKGHSPCLVVCCLSDPLQLSESQWNHLWNPVKPRRMLSKLMRCAENCSPYSQYSDNSSPWQCPTTQPTLQNLNKLGYKVLPHLPYSHDLLPTDYHFLKHLNNFLQWKRSHNQQNARRRFPRVHRIPKHWSLCYWNKQTYFSLAKMCWL